MALPANRPQLSKEEWLAAQIAEQRQKMEQWRESHPDDWKTLGELVIELFGTDLRVLDPASDECYMNDLCRDDVDASR
ncbi:MAG: hypothetical protein QM692_19575 [Thermomicrobiales bacterium]